MGTTSLIFIIFSALTNFSLLLNLDYRSYFFGDFYLLFYSPHNPIFLGTLCYFVLSFYGDSVYFLWGQLYPLHKCPQNHVKSKLHKCPHIVKRISPGLIPLKSTLPWAHMVPFWVFNQLRSNTRHI